MKILNLLGVIALSIIILAACGGSEQGNRSVDSNSIHKNNKQISSMKSGDQGNTSNSKGKEKGSTSDQSNQLDLKLGDSGIVKSNINKYKIKLQSFRIKKGTIGGEDPLLDQFIVAKISIKNIGSNNMNAEDVAGTLEVTDDLKGSGNPDDADLLGVTNTLKGVIAPGKSITGTAVFDVYSAKKYYLVDGSGLADQGAGLQNKVIWTFKASEAQ